MLLTKTEAKVRHWQHLLTNIAYKNRGNSEALAATAHQYCVKKSEAKVGHWLRQLTNLA